MKVIWKNYETSMFQNVLKNFIHIGFPELSKSNFTFTTCCQLIQDVCKKHSEFSLKKNIKAIINAKLIFRLP